MPIFPDELMQINGVLLLTILKIFNYCVNEIKNLSFRLQNKQKHKILLAHYDLGLNIIGTYISLIHRTSKFFSFILKSVPEKNVNTARTRTSTGAL